MKRSSIIYLFLFSAIIIFTSCAKAKTSDNNTLAPTNISISATVIADNSGNVAFTASATNAVSYEFDLGNGVFVTSASGTLTYKYLASGTYLVNVIAKSASGLTLSKSIQVSVNVGSGASNLVWSDEFDVNGPPNPLKWDYDLGAGGWGNAELEYYTSRTDNVIVSNGTLKIIAKKEDYNGSPYTSARMVSKGKFSFKYGRVEVSAKLPVGIGTWPAIWMLGSNFSTAGWPQCGEIDFMEARGSEPNKIFGTLHYPGHSGGNADGSTTTISNASTEFHKYTLDWTATSIQIYVDGHLYHTVANSGSLPFNQNFFFIMNVAMGGSFAGAIDPAYTSSQLEVDYIRVYQ
ncbi:MAG: family 16 glycosylhydrolase [Ginsengibacter sp.]|jgi:beta-glucanase (GH16 family)